MQRYHFLLKEQAFKSFFSFKMLIFAAKEYCDRFGIKERSSIFREATMERILAQLDDSHPTLF